MSDTSAQEMIVQVLLKDIFSDNNNGDIPLKPAPNKRFSYSFTEIAPAIQLTYKPRSFFISAGILRVATI